MILDTSTVPDVKTVYQIKGFESNLITIKGLTTFGQTFKKIKNSKKVDFVHVTKPVVSQMAAVISLRLLGRKFFWIQGFENPPTATFLTRLLLTQADRIIVTTKVDLNKLKSFGVEKSKIRYQK